MPVTNFAASALDQTTINVSWGEPVGEYDGFVVIVTSLLDEDYASPGQEWFITESPFLLTDLQPSTEYEITVVSILNATDEFEEQRSQSGGGMAMEMTGWFNCVLLTLPTCALHILQDICS